MTPEAPRKRLVFVSYSHRDRKPWLERILLQLNPLELEYPVEIWSDLSIEAGDAWRAKIADALGAANIFVLLISADFVASKFITEEEVPRLLAAAEKGAAVVLPVVLRATRLPGINELPDYQSINDPKRPLDRMTVGEREEVFKRVAERVEELLKPRDDETPTTQDEAEPKQRPRRKPRGECRLYVENFGAHIKSKNSLILLIYSLVTVVTLIWLTLVIAAFFFGQDLSMPRPLLAGGGLPCLGLAFYCIKEVIDIRLNVQRCEIMKGAFDSECPAWSHVEFEENKQRADELLRT